MIEIKGMRQGILAHLKAHGLCSEGGGTCERGEGKTCGRAPHDLHLERMDDMSKSTFCVSPAGHAHGIDVRLALRRWLAEGRLSKLAADKSHRQFRGSSGEQ